MFTFSVSHINFHQFRLISPSVDSLSLFPLLTELYVDSELSSLSELLLLLVLEAQSDELSILPLLGVSGSGCMSFFCHFIN